MKTFMIVITCFIGWASLCLSLSDSEYGTLLQMRDEIYTSQENFNRRLAALDDRVVALDKKVDYTVSGFTAIKTSNQDVESGNTITFTRVINDFDGDYDRNTNRFTCPSHAVYFVTANLERDRDVEVAVMLNNLRQLSLRDTRSNGLDTEYNTVTNAMLLECKFNEQIWLEATDSGRIYGSDQDNMYISTFTVFRLNDPFPGQELPIPETRQPDTI